MYKIQAIETKNNLIVAATFFDGTVKEYDVKKLIEIFPQFCVLRDELLFQKVKIDAGGYGISWNDELDLDADTIWQYGVKVGYTQMNPKMILASKLTKARYDAQITQAQLAEKTGIYQADISKIERGIANPSIETLQRLANGMGLSLDINFI